MGNGPESCADGHVGFLCISCADDYFKIGNECNVCPEQNVPLTLAIIMIAFIILAPFIKIAIDAVSDKVANTFEWIRSIDFSVFAALGFGVNFAQLTAVFGRFDLGWPDWMLSVFDWFSAVNVNVDLASPECSLNVDYTGKWFFIMSLPLMAAALWLIGACCLCTQRRYARRYGTYWRTTCPYVCVGVLCVRVRVCA